ncbi:MAG TPA: hypothetical protein PKC76_09320 [Saprospiraceae bacterium]|nr:hypothetical protein [Saprospiraceae bacterium]HMP24320.1 hypothetical protein [Saprospiraceae bacterium]
MKKNRKPPYENCAHGHFYRAALASGIAESEAVKLTERLKKLHDLDYFRSLDKDVLNISQAVKKAITGLPPQVQGEAARVLYEVLDIVDTPGVNPEKRFRIEQEFGDEFLRDLKKHIREDFHAALQGETYEHTYEMWLEGGYSKPPQKEIYNTATRRWESDIMPDGEYQKIVAKQKAIAEDHVQKNLTWYIEQFESQLSKSEAKERFVQQEMEMYKSILYNKDFTDFEVYWENGERIKHARNWTTFEHVWKNEIAYWVDQVIVKGIHELHEFMKPDDDGKYHRAIGPINAKVLYEYHKYLEKCSQELQKPTNEKHISNQSPSYFPEVPEILKTAFRELNLLSTTGQFTGDKKHIKPLYDTLQAKGWFKNKPSKTKKTDEFAALMHSEFRFSITGKTIRTGNRDEQQDDYFNEFNKTIKSNQTS